MTRRLSCLLLACGCVPGPSPSGDTDTDTSTGHSDVHDSDGAPDSDVGDDTELAGETDERVDTDLHGDDWTPPTGPCAPADRWTGPVPSTLVSTTPYPSTYDSGMAAVLPSFGDHRGGYSGADRATVIVDPTVVAFAARPGHSSEWVYLSDGLVTVPVPKDPADVQGIEVGDRVILGVNGWWAENGWVWFDDRSTTWHVDATDEPVYVRELGASNVDYAAARSQLVHVWGTVGAQSAVPCGDDHLCFLLQHDGTQDKLRVPADNTFGLDVDYAGGTLCAEAVAPVGVFQSDTGVAMVIDVADPSFLRVWPKP
jgi:hypothetical protein